MDYIINPSRMGGLVESIEDDTVTIHLHGRLGVISVPMRLLERKAEVGEELEFYFSYIQAVTETFDYDTYELESGADFNPCLLGGEIIEVNDTAIKARMINSLGTVAVPLRWLFSTVCPGVGENVEFYLSRMKVLDKPKVMQQFI